MNGKKAKRIRQYLEFVKDKPQQMKMGSKFITLVKQTTGEQFTFEVPTIQAVNDPSGKRGIYKKLKKQYNEKN